MSKRFYGIKVYTEATGWYYLLYDRELSWLQFKELRFFVRNHIGHKKSAWRYRVNFTYCSGRPLYEEARSHVEIILTGGSKELQVMVRAAVGAVH